MSLDVSTIPSAPAENELAEAFHESPDTLALLARRRSAKLLLLSEPAPTAAELHALIRLSARVPDHGKLGPWRFVVIDGAARARAGDALAKVIAGDDGVDDERLAFVRGHFLRAPACVLVVSTAAPHKKIPEWEQQLSAGAVCFSMLVSAHAMGFAGCWLSEWPTYDERARAALGLATHERIAGFVYLGAASGPVIERIRPDITERISYF